VSVSVWPHAPITFEMPGQCTGADAGAPVLRRMKRTMKQLHATAIVESGDRLRRHNSHPRPTPSAAHMRRTEKHSPPAPHGSTAAARPGVPLAPGPREWAERRCEVLLLGRLGADVALRLIPRASHALRSGIDNFCSQSNFSVCRRGAAPARIASTSAS
jgi:hypothetical protein